MSTFTTDKYMKSETLSEEYCALRGDKMCNQYTSSM